MRPTRRHIAISPQSGLYAMPSLCTLTPVSRRPVSGSVLSLAVLCRHVALRDHGKPVGCFYPVPSPTALAFDYLWKSRHFPHPPPSDSRGGVHFRGLPTVRFRLQPADLLAPLVGADQARTQPTGTFTSGLPADWSPAPPPDIGNWASSTGGTYCLHPL